MAGGAEPRRTQQERRESTITRLLDGAISALADLGYARTTVKEVCERAGVSQGALFRYFPTRNDLMAAAAAEVARRQISSFVVESQTETGPSDDPLVATLRLVQRRARNPINAVWYELLAAARTDPALRGAIAPTATDYLLQVRDAAAALPFASEFPPELLTAAIRIVLHVIGGEALLDPTEPDPRTDEHTVHLLAALFRSVTDDPS